MKLFSSFPLVLLILCCFQCGQAETLINLNTIEDWRPASDVMNVSAIEEGFQFFSTGPDPYIISKPLEFSATDFKAIVLEMSVTKGSQLQVFWATKSTPHFNEPNSARLPIEADGKRHTYTLSLASNEKWRGGITRLRLDPTDTNAKIGMHAFKIIDRIGPRIKALGLYPHCPFARPGEPIELTAHFKNEGDMDGTVAIDRQSTTVAAGEEMEIHAGTARAETEKAYPISVNWKGLDHNKKEIASGSLSTMVEFFDCENESDTIRLSCPTWDATIFQTQMGYGPMRFRMKGVNMAWMPRLGTLWVSGRKSEPQGIPLFAEEGKRISPSHYRFAHAIKDRSGHEWSYQLDVTKRTKPDALHLAYALQSDGGKLLHFSGPELYIGERSFGQAKDMAVFPGIEYLDRDAVSSSHAVAHPPVRDHYMPHPYKNTIPFMSLTHNGNLIALLWPPHHAWGREGTTLSPQFAVPNRLEHQDNHLFSLFVPNVPDYTLENRAIAHKPYILEPGETIGMEAVVYLGKSEDPCAAFDAWLRVYQQGDFPEPFPAPRSYEEEIALSRQAYLTSCWNEEAKGWGHCVGWDPLHSGGMLALLELDKFLTKDKPIENILQKRIHVVYDKILETRGPRGLGNPAGCHVMTFEPDFFWGVVDKSLGPLHQQAVNLMQAQNPDGSWGFQPGDKQKDLGEAGEVVSGTIAPKAMRLMRWARISGDPVATQAGLKGVEALNRRTVPRGSQGWECPIAAADVMVSGYGARANLDAWRITQEQTYMKKAIYWARTGIPFHYLWNLDDRPLQRYATIPIFGTTYFTHSWRGVPVQWCGLVYAYALQELARFNDAYPWRKIAEGIINSAMHQQMTEGEAIGTLPDSYGEYFVTPRPAFINPENIMTNLHMLEGNSLNINTQFLAKPAKNALRISANGEISKAKKMDQAIHFNLSAKPGRKLSVLIAPLDEEPRTIRIKPLQTIPPKTQLHDTNYGWHYLPKHKALVMRVEIKQKGSESVEISFSR